MEVEGGGQRCCREKEWSTGYPPPNPFKKSLSLRDFCVLVPDGLLTWQDWAQCRLVTGTFLYGKSKAKPQFCAKTTGRSLASSTCTRRCLTSELQRCPHAILHHVLPTGGASNITITLCPLLFFCLKLQMCLGLPHRNLAAVSQSSAPSSPSHCGPQPWPFIYQGWI